MHINQLVSVNQLKQYKDTPFEKVPMHAKIAHLHYLQSQYRMLVVKLAWRAWRTLPAYTKSWIGVDDIVEDGMLKALKYSIKRFDPNKARFITGLHHYLHNHFLRNYIEWYGNEKRGVVSFEVEVPVRNRLNKIVMKKETKHRATPIVSIDTGFDRPGEAKISVEAMVPNLVVSEDTLFRDVVSECFVIPAIEQVYNQASEKLQQAIVAWFLRSGGNVDDIRVPKNGRRFNRLSCEFRELCFRYHVECDDCIHVVRSPKCLDSLSRKLLWIPYDLDNPTPRDLERPKFKGQWF